MIGTRIQPYGADQIMLDLLILPVLLQLTAVPDEFFEQEYSIATAEALSRPDQTELETITEVLEQLAEQGDDSAYEALGELYAYGGLGIAVDPERGCDYFEAAGEKRQDALHNLATCYYNGNGRTQDLSRARELYVEAAEAGWRMSYCAYGNMLVKGEGGPVDAEEGIRLCRMTAVLGDADAQTDYGGYLLTGNGVERDPVAARFMLEQAGVQEQSNAAFLLGQIHTRGDGTPVDHRLAGEWFANSYEWGRRDAAFQAALTYMRRGYTQNDDGTASVRPDLLSEAKVWLVKAAEAARPGSEQYLEATQLIDNLDQLLAGSEPINEG